MSKKIIFSSQFPNLDILKPQPASRAIPEWYRLTPGVKEKQETVKKCIPILDALTTGYVIPLPADVWKRKGDPKFHEDTELKIVSEHIPVQTDMFPNPEEFDPQPYKWNNYWYIKTPKGYSTYFTHPVNSPFLPFYSFTGVVDTDKHPLIINFPFLIRKDFDGVIPAGTPMIQLFPFKRSDWNMDVIDDKEPPNYSKQFQAMGQAPFAWYKRQWWSKKIYS
jgi:hypothetical protein